MKRSILATLFLLAFSVLSRAEQSCPLPPSLKPLAENSDMFSEEQESDLGDVVAQSIAADVRAVKDDPVSAHLSELGARLVKYLPETHYRYQFSLIDLPQVNAFSLPGGRVYVSRKLIALAHNDDELAGVIAHELGHIVTRQGAVEITKAFRTVGINQVASRSEVYDGYFKYLNEYRRKPQRLQSGVEDERQLVADQVGIYAMTRAGYNPEAFSQILDRLQETHGKTGSWVTDLFGTTKPSQKRLRETFKNMAALPAGCAEARPASDIAAFQQWQAKVIESRPTVEQGDLPGLLFKQQLALPLRPDITNLRFSPDGKLALAQDAGGIHVLSREPLAELFFIDAEDAYKANFSPDSGSIVFYTHEMRVEVWDIASRQRTSVHEILLNEPCWQSTLSPDGKYLGCLKADLSLYLLDVSNGEVLATKPNFFQIRTYYGWILFLELVSKGDAELIHMQFSPDARYFLAGSRLNTMAYDLSQKREANIPGSIRSATQEEFTFDGTDRVVTMNPYAANKSPVYRFPSGEKIGELPLSNSTHLRPVTHGDWVLLWPLKESPLGVMDLQKRSLILSFKRDAGDMYDNSILSERVDGEIAISDLSTKQVAAVRLNQSRLGALETAAVSSDFNWLAYSTETRGATWDLTRNIRINHTRSFRGAWFAEDHSLYADFPKLDKEERSVVRLDSYGGGAAAYTIQNKYAKQMGSRLLLFQPAHEDSTERKDWTVELHDLRSQQLLWSRRFPREVPEIAVGAANLMVLSWPANASAARDEMNRFPDIKSKAEREDYFIEILDFTKDSVVNKLLVKTNKGSFRVRYAVVDGDWAVLSCSGDRVLIYSLTTGEEKGHLFGAGHSISAAAGLHAVSNSAGQLVLYDLASSQIRRQYQFPAGIALQRFSEDGKRMFVLTSDQTAYAFDLTKN